MNHKQQLHPPFTRPTSVLVHQVPSAEQLLWERIRLAGLCDQVAKGHLVVRDLVEPGLIALTILCQHDPIHTPDASSSHDTGVAALFLQVALQELCLQPLHTAGYLRIQAHVLAILVARN